MKKISCRVHRVLLCLTIFVGASFIHADYQTSVYKKIAQQNLKTLEWEDEEWPENSHFAHLNHCLKVLRIPQPFQKRKCAFDLIGQINDQKHPIIDRLVDATTCLDLELLRGKEGDAPYLGSIINKAYTEVGYVTLLTMLSLFSTNDIPELRKRQTVVRQLLDDPTFFEQLGRIYKNLRRHENYIISLWHRRDPLRMAMDRNYYNLPLLNRLNNYVAPLESKNLLGHYKNITFLGMGILASGVLIGYGMNYLFRIKQSARFNKLQNRFQGGGGEIEPLTTLLSFLSDRDDFQRGVALIGGVFCGLSVRQQAEWLRDMFFLDICVQIKLMHISRYIEQVRQLVKLLQSHPQFMHCIPGTDELITIIQNPQQISSQLNELLKLLSTRTFKGKPSIISLQGRVARACRLIHDVKDDLAPMFEAIGYIDVYLSVGKLYKEFEQQRVAYTFAEYQTSDVPGIVLKDFWNPFISSDKVVPNSVSLGFAKDIRNMVLTGPNAGGKSTIIKSIAISIILAQTFGIVPARYASITPFAKVGTHLNITDDIASGNSLFKSEVNRAQELIQMINSLKDGEHAFMIMDELFNGTTPSEGQAAAFSFANYIGAYPNIICLIATHFELLAQLEKETQNFMNYKVLINRDENNQIKYTFKLVPGISDQHIALDILRSEGFPSMILDPATALLENQAL